MHTELPISVFEATNEVTGPIAVIPEISLCRQDPNLDRLEPCEFERYIEESSSSFVQGKLRANFSFWQDTVQASDFVLDIIRNGYKILLILDLSHLNKFVVKKSVKYKDLRTVLQLFSPSMFVFSFDLKSAYHQIDICEEVSVVQMAFSRRRDESLRV